MDNTPEIKKHLCVCEEELLEALWKMDREKNNYDDITRTENFVKIIEAIVADILDPANFQFETSLQHALAVLCRYGCEHLNDMDDQAVQDLYEVVLLIVDLNAQAKREKLEDHIARTEFYSRFGSPEPI